ncbi:MAG TPA: thioredoxin family protein [Acidobacteriaceae bacterium]|nr:thioredoxin family protein [Acidobacteriaceae bacterium]
MMLAAPPLATHEVVSQEEWLERRKELLLREKELTRQRDAVDEARRALPWVKVEKEYVFQGPNGRETLADFFAGRSQLIVQHFMFGPSWNEGCVGCSFKSDHIDGALTHLEHHDVSFVSVSEAPYEKIAAFRKRMGWRFHWVSAYGSDFNYDFHVSFRPEELATGRIYYNYDLRPAAIDQGPGDSVFCRNERGEIFHTYSTFGRGDEMLTAAYMYLDMTPLGRNENGPSFTLMDWVKHHDGYESAQSPASCCHGAKNGH